MKRLLCCSVVFFTCFFLLIATDRQAFAYYVDPGSGLLMLQSAASVMVAVGYFMRRRIRALFGGREEAAVVQVPLAAEKGGTHKEA